jgi:hypothetical protein
MLMVNPNKSKSKPTVQAPLLLQRIKDRFVNHPIGALIAVLMIAVMGIAQFTDAWIKLKNNIWPDSVQEVDYSKDSTFLEAQQLYFMKDDDDGAYNKYLAAANQHNPLAMAAVAKMLYFGRGGISRRERG